MSNPLDFTDLYTELGGFDLTSRNYTPQHFECLHKISLACLEQLRADPATGPFTSLMLSAGGHYDLITAGVHEGNSAALWLTGRPTDSAETFIEFIREVFRRTEGLSNPICFPVVDGVPRLCFALRGAPTNYLLTPHESFTRRHTKKRYSEYKVTYLESLSQFVEAATKYLEDFWRPSAHELWEQERDNGAARQTMHLFELTPHT